METQPQGWVARTAGTQGVRLGATPELAKRTAEAQGEPISRRGEAVRAKQGTVALQGAPQAARQATRTLVRAVQMRMQGPVARARVVRTSAVKEAKTKAEQEVKTKAEQEVKTKVEREVRQAEPGGTLGATTATFRVETRVLICPMTPTTADSVVTIVWEGPANKTNANPHSSPRV